MSHSAVVSGTSESHSAALPSTGVGMPPARDAGALPPLSPDQPGVKHCPVCGRTYPRDERFYCSYDSGVLAEGVAPPPEAETTAAAFDERRRWTRRALWALALSAAAVTCGYYADRHRTLWASWLPSGESRLAADYPHEVTSASLGAGALKGSGTQLPPPAYPAAARARGVTGSVTVEVTVDGGGRVTAARALDGPEVLRGAAEEAARKIRVKGRESGGSPRTVKYDFMLCRDDGACVW